MEGLEHVELFARADVFDGLSGRRADGERRAAAGVAVGCGLEVVDVNRLLKQFEMMQDLVKQMTRGRMPKGLGGFGGKGGMSRMHGFGRKKRFK